MRPATATRKCTNPTAGVAWKSTPYFPVEAPPPPRFQSGDFEKTSKSSKRIHVEENFACTSLSSPDAPPYKKITIRPIHNELIRSTEFFSSTSFPTPASIPFFNPLDFPHGFAVAGSFCPRFGARLAEGSCYYFLPRNTANISHPAFSISRGRKLGTHRGLRLSETYSGSRQPSGPRP